MNVKKQRKILISESSSDSEYFNVNEDYANKYDEWRHKEEFQKLKAKYGDSSPSSSSSSESEEENISTFIEKDFFKTLSLLKSKNPKIYDENQSFFTNTITDTEHKAKHKKAKALYLKDYERERLLETNGKFNSDNDNKNINVDFSQTYAEQQKDLKDSFKEALVDSDSSEECEESLLKVRKTCKAEKEKNEDEYITWLKGEKDLPKEKADQDLDYLYSYWNNPNLGNDEIFLKNYILNKRYMENDGEKILTYDEITNDVNALNDDDTILNQQEVFEHKYNFRFEEPDSEFIKQYPRTIGDSLRRADNKRKLERENYMERKRKEKEEKKEEIRRLKALKRAEIENMLNKIKETTGNSELGFNYTDIDGDFNPDEHDKRMKELFNNEFYKIDESDKPQFPSDEEIDCENWDDWLGNDENEVKTEHILHCEDPDFNMDADYDPKLKFQKQMIESHSKKSKKKKRKSKFVEVLSESKPVFNPSEQSLEEYINEYYKLDFEDVIGGEVFRFKYRNVIPNNFGLSVDEIFKARDKELNKWCSLKKTCQHRSQQEETYDIAAYSKKAENIFAKKKMFPSLFENPEQTHAQNTSINLSDSTDFCKRIKGAKKDIKMKCTDKTENMEESSELSSCMFGISATERKGKHKKREKKKLLAGFTENQRIDIVSHRNVKGNKNNLKLDGGEL